MATEPQTLRIPTFAFVTGLLSLLLVMVGYIYLTERSRIDRLEVQVATLTTTLGSVQTDLAVLRRDTGAMGIIVDRIDQRIATVQQQLQAR